MTITTATSAPVKQHGIFYKIWHKLPHLCRRSGNVEPDNIVDITKISNTNSTKHVQTTENNSRITHVNLEAKQIPQSIISFERQEEPSKSEQLAHITNAAQAYSPSSVHKAPHTPSASTYLTWARQRQASIANLKQNEDPNPYVKQALDFAIKATALGANGGVQIIQEIFESHTVPNEHAENGIIRSSDDSRLTIPGTHDILFWKNVEKSQSTRRPSNPSMPPLGGCNSPARVTNHEIAAQFIIASRSVVNDLESLPETFVTRWVDHFNTAVSTRKLPNFDLLRAEYQAAVHPRNSQTVNITM